VAFLSLEYYYLHDNNKNATHFPQLFNTVEIREKLKELEMARIERQIAEERGAISKLSALDRLAVNYKVLLYNLHDNGYLIDGDYEWLISECFWCGQYEMMSEEISKDMYGWKCHNCGKSISRAIHPFICLMTLRVPPRAQQLSSLSPLMLDTERMEPSAERIPPRVPNGTRGVL